MLLRVSKQTDEHRTISFLWTGYQRCMANVQCIAVWWCTVPAYIDTTEPVKHVRVIKNKIIVLRCPVQGIPLPNITWSKAGEPLEPDERIRFLMSGRQLEISMSQESDTAWYTCTADNVAGSAKIDYNLTVIGTDYWICHHTLAYPEAGWPDIVSNIGTPLPFYLQYEPYSLCCRLPFSLGIRW